MNAQCWGVGRNSAIVSPNQGTACSQVGVAESLFLCTQRLHESYKPASLGRKCASNMESVCWSVEADLDNFRILEKEMFFGFGGRMGPSLVM